MAGSVRVWSWTSCPILALSAALSSATCLSLKRLGRDDLGLDFALLGGNQCAIGLDHAFDREEPAVLGDKLEEIDGSAVDASALGNCGERGNLVLGGENGRAHEAL